MLGKIKIVFMGTPNFAVPPLLALIKDTDFEICAVVTNPDKKTGRKQILTASPVKRTADENSITVLQPPGYSKNPEIINLLRGLKPDFIVVAAYGHILPKDVLEIPRCGCINIHGSMLPNYRGASPVEEALIRGDHETGVTFIKMTEKLDAGPVYAIFRLPIDREDTSPTLRQKLSQLAAAQLPYLLKDIMSGDQPNPIEQDDSKASYCQKISKEDGFLDLKTETAETVRNKVRAYDPWPGCFLVFPGKKIRLVKTGSDNSSPASQKAKPYQLIELAKNAIGIGTKEGMIVPLELQIEGKKILKIHDFLSGNRDLLIKLLESAR